MPASIEVFFQELGDAEYDTETGEFTYPTDEVIIFSGNARIQPIRMARTVNNNAADTTIQTVRVQVAAPDLVLRPNYKMRVTSSPLNKTLTKFRYVVYDVMDSSNPIERTFDATVDTEVQL